MRADEVGPGWTEAGAVDSMGVLDGTGPWCLDTDAEEFRFRAKYFSCLATIANVWRGPGVRGKLMRAAEPFGDAVVALFEKTPPRCLRGRWGSVDDVEAAVISVLQFAYEVFNTVFGIDGAGGE